MKDMEPFCHISIYEDAFKGKGFIQPYADNPLDHEIVWRERIFKYH